MERSAFAPGWYASLPEAHHAGLAQAGAARASKADDLLLLKPADASDAALRSELQAIEGKVQAIGQRLSERRFQHVRRQPSLLDPPAIDPAVKAAILRKSAEKHLEFLHMSDAQLEDGSSAAAAKKPKGKRGQPPPPPPAVARDPNAKSAFHQLFESQVKCAHRHPASAASS